MYIKQVIIEGFKSYKDQIATDTFSPKHNCVVGANGSGKSNFFHAIRFVLSDLFVTLRAEDRQALLHEGSGNQVTSAFVEIVFDNSDGRIPVDRDEVRLRRTIGVKKDEYFLDKKHVNKSEVTNLLESAGFSRSNPYYVVQQGKIASLTTMKDVERLTLLKEIGGTQVYEERRKESLKIMQDTENRRNQIIEVVRFIEERLGQLEEEKEELKKYQQLDKQRRSLEYTLFDKELADTRQKLEEVEEKRLRASQESGSMHNGVMEAHEKLKMMEKDLKAAAKEMQTLEKEKDAVEAEKTDLIKAAAKADIDVRELQDKMKMEKRMKSNIAKEKVELESEVKRSTEDLAAVTPEHEEYLEREQEIIKGIADREKQLSILYQKQGRSKQFANRAERDRWLQKDIRDLEVMVKKKQAQMATLQEEIQQLNGSCMDRSAEIDDKISALERMEQQIEGCKAEHAERKRQRDESTNRRKELWRNDSEIESTIQKLREESKKYERNFEYAIPREISRGLSSVRRICRDHNIQGVAGALIELLDCDDKFNTAIEVTAGNSLFHVVVETDDISTRIVRYLNAERGGRVTFMPLNQLRPHHVRYPSSPDVVPILQKLKFKDMYANAFAQVFSKTLICRDLEVATNMARNTEMDCVTLEGDQVNRRGALTGGYHDSRRSRLSAMKSIKSNVAKMEQLDQEGIAMKGEIERLDQSISQTLGELQKQEAKIAHLCNQREQLKQELKAIRDKEATNKKTLVQKEKLIASTEKGLRELEERVASLKEELGTDLTSDLTPAEQKLLSVLNPEIRQLKQDLVNCKTKRMEIETRKSELEELLSANLLKRQSELQQQLTVMDVETRTIELDERKRTLAEAKASVDDVSRRQKDISDQLAQYVAKMRDLESKKDELKGLEDKYNRTLQDEAKDLEQLLNKRNVLLLKREDLMKKIRDLGSLPSDAFEKYQSKGLKELHKMLHRCNEQLKKYGHVNKKALDQYVSFTEQREELHKRQAELEMGDKKIRELIAVLDQRKDESIERTFKGVAKNFREAFADLVQGGRGQLVMMNKRKATEAANDDDEEEEHHEGEEVGRVEKYVGVKVKVSFTGRGETQSMKQLSGGQKTVVALTLIFAIQRCDPAPFYLFDEIDAALDPQYRTAVGNMIKRQTEIAPPTQFITTTFRPELVKVADRIYGVSHKNRVSRVDVISQDDALRFIEADHAQPRA